MKNIFRNIAESIGFFFGAIFNIPLRLKFIIPLLIIAVAVTGFYSNKKAIERIGGNDFIEDAKHYVEVKDACDKYFISEVDRNSMGDSAAAAIVSGLGDKWSYYMTETEYNSYKLYSANEYSGIGMTLAAVPNGYQVVTVSSGSAAADAGLAAGMIIEAVDGNKLAGVDMDTARTLIRSRLNTKFTLSIAGGTELNIDCAKTYISSVNYRMEKTEAGYVQLLNFEAGSGDDAAAAIEELLDSGAVALVIDVRNNPGGLAVEVQKLLDYLLPSCELFCSTDKAGKRTDYNSDSVCIQIPICVLLNSGTYAEAEVFAQVLKEYNWATLLGEPSTGMTRTQEIIELSDGSAIRLSTKAYITSAGNDICVNGGVVPDMIIYNSDESATGTTTGTTGVSDGTGTMSNDDQLMAALRYLS